MAQTDVVFGTRIDADDGKVSGGRCVCPYCNGVFELSGSSMRTSANQMSCKRCGFEWESRKGDPMKCCRCHAWRRFPDGDFITPPPCSVCRRGEGRPITANTAKITANTAKITATLPPWR